MACFFFLSSWSWRITRMNIQNVSNPWAVEDFKASTYTHLRKVAKKGLKICSLCLWTSSCMRSQCVYVYVCVFVYWQKSSSAVSMSLICVRMWCGSRQAGWSCFVETRNESPSQIRHPQFRVDLMHQVRDLFLTDRRLQHQPASQGFPIQPSPPPPKTVVEFQKWLNENARMDIHFHSSRLEWKHIHYKSGKP